MSQLNQVLPMTMVLVINVEQAEKTEMGMQHGLFSCQSVLVCFYVDVDQSVA